MIIQIIIGIAVLALLIYRLGIQRLVVHQRAGRLRRAGPVARPATG